MHVCAACTVCCVLRCCVMGLLAPSYSIGRIWPCACAAMCAANAWHAHCVACAVNVSMHRRQSARSKSMQILHNAQGASRWFSEVNRSQLCIHLPHLLTARSRCMLQCTASTLHGWRWAPTALAGLLALARKDARRLGFCVHMTCCAACTMDTGAQAQSRQQIESETQRMARSFLRMSWHLGC